MYENRDSNPRDIDTIEAWYTDSNNDFWGGKLDWRINDNHLLELLAFPDEAESDTTKYNYDWDTATRRNSVGQRYEGSGGDSRSLTYTRKFTQNFDTKAQSGVNTRNTICRSPWDATVSKPRGPSCRAREDQ